MGNYKVRSEVRRTSDAELREGHEYGKEKRWEAIARRAGTPEGRGKEAGPDVPTISEGVAEAYQRYRNELIDALPSMGRMDLESPPAQRAAAGTIAAVTRFVESAPRSPSAGKKNADTRIVVTINPSTGLIEHLQFATEADKTAKIHTEDGRLSFPVSVIFDKKNNVSRLTLDPSTITSLHRLSGNEISTELRQALGGLHGRPLEVPSVATEASKPSPLATGALSLGGLLAITPDILEVGAVAAATVLLGRVLFNDSGPKPSYFRRFLHLFSHEMAVNDWSDKASALHRGPSRGKIEDTKSAYQKAIALASEGPSENLWSLQNEYGSFFESIGEYGNAVHQFEAAHLTSRHSSVPAAPLLSKQVDDSIYGASEMAPTVWTVG